VFHSFHSSDSPQSLRVSPHEAPQFPHSIFIQRNVDPGTIDSASERQNGHGNFSVSVCVDRSPRSTCFRTHISSLAFKLMIHQCPDESKLRICSFNANTVQQPSQYSAVMPAFSFAMAASSSTTLASNRSINSDWLTVCWLSAVSISAFSVFPVASLQQAGYLVSVMRHDLAGLGTLQPLACQ